MKRTLLVLAAAGVLALAGCATEAQKNAEAHVVEAQTLMKGELLESAKATAAAPLFEITCPDTGCQFKSLKVANPQASAQMADVVRTAFAPPPPSPWVTAYTATLDTLGRLGVFGIVAHGVSSIFHDQAAYGAQTATAGFASNAEIAGRIPQPAANVTNTTTTTTNTTVTASGPGAGAASGGNATGNAPTTTSTTTTNPAPTVVTCTGTPPTCSH